MQELRFQDNSFSLNNSQKYNLSIQVSLDGFSFFMQDSVTKSFCYFSHTPYCLSGEYGLLKKTTELLKLNGLTNTQFNSTTILIGNNTLRLIPSAFSNEKNIKQLPGYRSKELKDRKLIVSQLTGKYQLLFLMASELYDIFAQLFPGSVFMHEIQSVINLNLSNITSSSILVDCIVHNQFILISVVNDSEILFLNSFNVSNRSDILYYLASVLESYPGSEYEINFSGTINEVDYLFLSDYLKNSKIRTIRNTKLNQLLPDNFPQQRITPLLAFHDE